MQNVELKMQNLFIVSLNSAFYILNSELITLVDPFDDRRHC